MRSTLTKGLTTAVCLLFCGAMSLLQPALAQVISDGTGGNLVLAPGAHTIDTGSGEIDGLLSAGWDGAHFHLADIDVQAGAILSISGSLPLVLLASGDISIAGTLVGIGSDGDGIAAEDLFGAFGGNGGSGGYAGGIGGGSPGFASGIYFRAPGVLGDGPAGGDGGIAASSDVANADYGSGAGAGHAASGGNGGSAGNGAGGIGGAEVGSGFLGGSGGGGGSQEDDDADVGSYNSTDDGGAGGGGGGAAVRIVAAGALSVSGKIDVAGGAGGDSVESGAGGGGAGGRIELLSPVLPTVTGPLVLDGGAGGLAPQAASGGGAGAAGTTRIESYTASVCSVGGTNLVLGPGTYTIDTDLGEIDDVLSPGFDGFAFHFHQVDIAAGATLVAKGSAPLVILAGGDVVVAGSIAAAGEDGDDGGSSRDGGAGGAAGPGGFSGGRGGGVTPGTGTAAGEAGDGPGAGAGGLYPAIAVGGGGGGHAVMGQDGINDGGSLAPGGAAYAIDSPLIGGSGGGGGTIHYAASTGGGAGGGGGGAVRIIGSANVTITGTIDVHGGEGGRGPGRAGGGGGGSGGSIDLQATGSLAAGSATLNVTGGVAGISDSGNAQGGTGADGRVTSGSSACQAPQTDVSISKSDDQLIFIPGSPITYMITVTNNGPMAVAAANVSDSLPPELSNATWDCFPELQASCTVQGSGNIDDDAVSLGVGSSVLYVLTASTAAQFVGVIINTATVMPLSISDGNPSNNSATDRSATDQGHADGFE